MKLVYTWLLLMCLPMSVSAIDKGVVIPSDLLLDNIKTTDYSAVVQLLSVKRVGQFGGPPSLTGYVNIIYTAKVLETLKGPELAQIKYAVMADADYQATLPQNPVLVSLCQSGNVQFYTPDNGYVSAVTDAVLVLARQAVKTKSNNTACQ